MPRRPKRPCNYPGCPELIDARYCDEHKKLTDKYYNRYQRDSFSNTFYNTPQWKLIRKRQLIENPFCAECLKSGKPIKATMVDHIVPIKQGGEKHAQSNLPKSMLELP